MPRYEIVAHLTCELACETAEDAAAVFHHEVMAEAGVEDDVLQLAVWREESAAHASPLPTTLRQQLIAFFAALERSAGEAEAAFRERVAAILTISGPALQRPSSAAHPASPRIHV